MRDLVDEYAATGGEPNLDLARFTTSNHAIRPDYATTMADLYRNAEQHADLQERVEFHVDAVAMGLAFCIGFLVALFCIGG